MVLELSLPLSQFFVKVVLDVLLGRFDGHVGGSVSGGGVETRVMGIANNHLD